MFWNAISVDRNAGQDPDTVRSLFPGPEWWGGCLPAGRISPAPKKFAAATNLEPSWSAASERQSTRGKIVGLDPTRKHLRITQTFVNT